MFVILFILLVPKGIKIIYDDDDDDDDDNNSKQIISYNYVYILLYVCYPIYFIGTERNKNYL